MLEPAVPLKIGGAGFKVLNVIEGKADAYLMPRRAIGYWDICAAQALIEGMGGVCTDLQGNRLSYANKNDPTLPAFLISRSPSMHTSLLRRISKLLPY